MHGVRHSLMRILGGFHGPLSVWAAHVHLEGGGVNITGIHPPRWVQGGPKCIFPSTMLLIIKIYCSHYISHNIVQYNVGRCLSNPHSSWGVRGGSVCTYIRWAHCNHQDQVACFLPPWSFKYIRNFLWKKFSGKNCRSKLVFILTRCICII